MLRKLDINPCSQPLKLFIIYAREDQPALLELKAHLRPLEKRGDLTVWYDGEILPGQNWDEATKEQLAAADIVLLFISKHFFNSEYIEKEELKKAFLQVLPKDGKPVSRCWGDVDEAWENIARGIQTLISEDDGNQELDKEEDSYNGKDGFEKLAINFVQKRSSKYKETTGQKFVSSLINILLIGIMLFFLFALFGVIFR